MAGQRTAKMNKPVLIYLIIYYMYILSPIKPSFHPPMANKEDFNDALERISSAVRIIAYAALNIQCSVL